jgi:G3E family GTPase
LQSELYLDGVITVVDAKYIEDYLIGDEMNEAMKQIAMADRLLLNKCDLVPESCLNAIESKIREINNTAVLKKTTKANVEIDFIFDLHSFDGEAMDPFVELNHTPHVHSSITTIVFETPGVVERNKMESWIQQILWEHEIPGEVGPSPNVVRFKALINTGSEFKFVVQAVQELYDIQQGQKWEEEAMNKLVFIGRDLDKVLLKKSFLNTMFS